MTTDLVVLGEEEELELVGSLMRFRRIRHLPVVRGGKLVGLVSHRDLLRAWAHVFVSPPAIEEGSFYAKIVVRDIMTAELTSVSPGTPLVEAAKTLLDHRYGCLPVTEEDGRLVGIVTEVDFLRWAIGKLEA